MAVTAFAASERAADAAHFRRTLGQIPTAAVVIAANGRDGVPAGMSVGTFGSVSLAPPLAAFCPARRSTSWPKIERAGVFCANILAAEQEDLCRTFARSGEDKFGGLRWRPAPITGSPILDDVSGWVDCEIESTIQAGDHFIVLARVLDLDVEPASRSLIFYRGDFGSFFSYGGIRGTVATRSP